MAGGSDSGSQSTEVTPEAFKELQQPFADVIQQLLGFQPVAGGGAGAVSGSGGAISNRGQQPQGLSAGAADRDGNPLGLPTVNRNSGGGGGGTIVGERNFPGGAAFEANGDPSDVLRGIPTQDTPFAAELGANEQSLLDQLFGTGTGGSQSASAQLLNETIGGSFLPGEGGSNPFLQEAIEAAQRPTLQGLEETLSRTLPGRFTSQGQFTQPEGSSAFDRAAALATRGSAQALSDIASQLSFAGFESERGRQQDAALAAPGVQAQEINNLVTNLQAQALPRMIEQFGLDAATQQFNNQMNQLMGVLSLAQGAGTPVLSQSSSGSSKGSAAPFLTAAASIAGAAAMASDERLKKNIHQIGAASNGIPLYTFLYIWEDDNASLRIGMLAQEVMQVIPEAVSVLENGYMVVDYERAMGEISNG